MLVSTAGRVMETEVRGEVCRENEIGRREGERDREEKKPGKTGRGRENAEAERQRAVMKTNSDMLVELPRQMRTEEKLGEQNEVNLLAPQRPPQPWSRMDSLEGNTRNQGSAPLWGVTDQR